jgi:hypothetical protein
VAHSEQTEATPYTHHTLNDEQATKISLTAPLLTRAVAPVQTKNNEYEVEKINGVYLNRGELCYTVHCGWKVERKLYPASDFKNSPDKLREFHNADPANLGRNMSRISRSFA